jgi:lipopolysaccharide export LptBFGC system permease protein LptF
VSSLSLWLSDPRVRRGLGLGGGVLFLIALGLGGAPWQRGFWIALAVLIAVLLPFVATGLFLWQRDR